MQNNKIKKKGLHPEIFTERQKKLLPLIKKFYKKFGLVGGTAIALHIGHRESIDFDLFSCEEFNVYDLKRKISEDSKKITEVFVSKSYEFTFLLNEVKITFFHYPFKIDYEVDFDNILRTPSLLTLAAMKAYALGMRAKWKDYVDLYFIMRDYHSFSEIVEQTRAIFGSEFNEKVFRSQLSYFEDINYSEKVIYKKGYEVSDDEIRKSLIEFSLS